MKTFDWIRNTVLVVVILPLLAGCASLKSTKLIAAQSKQGGIVYYLPKQVMRLTLTVPEPPKAGSDEKPEKRSLRLELLTPVADTSKAYQVRYLRNHVGSNMLKVAVNSKGLLDGDGAGKTDTDLAKLIEAVVGTAVGEPQEIDSRGGSSHDDCANPGVYTWSFEPVGKLIEGGWDSCRIRIWKGEHRPPPKVVVSGCKRASGPKPSECGYWSLPPKPSTLDAQDPGKDGIAGYYYRQSLPLELTVHDNILHLDYHFFDSAITTESPLRYFTFPKPIFATADWKVTFTDGAPTVYEITSGGDAFGLIKLPADVIQAYSDAILSGFKRKTAMQTAEVTRMNEINELAIAEAKRRTCAAIVASTSDYETIKAACGE